jgi:hypothetical protein
LAEDEGFLKRWSRRKVEARQGEPAAPAPDLPQAEPSAPIRRARAEADAAATLPALPDIESLTPQSDFSVFMQDGVPSDTRTRALQKLWRLDPAFGEMDDLRDYSDDYTDQAVATGAVRTLYKIGRGFLDEEKEEEAAAAPGAAAPPDRSQPPPSPDAPAEDRTAERDDEAERKD